MSAPRQPPLPYGVLLVVASLLFAAMALFVKGAASELGGPEIAFVRSSSGLLACALVATRRRFVYRNRWGLFWRGVTGACAVYFYFLGIQHLPVGIATLLNYTAPIFTALFSGLFLGKGLGRRTLLALAIATIGLAFVLSGQAPPGSLGLGRWELVGLCGATFSGIAMAIIGEVRKTDGAWEIFSVFSFMTMLATAPAALAGFHAPSHRVTWILVGMALSSISAQVTMTYTMGFVGATLAGVINQITPVASLLVGWFVFTEHFGTTTAIGIAITLAGGVYGAWLASQRGE